MLKITNEGNYEIESKVLKKVCKSVCKSMGQKFNKLYLIINFVDREKIHEINKEYRNKDKETDVISFRMLDGALNKKVNKENYPFDYDRSLKKVFLGELFICYDIAVEQATEYGHSTRREISFLVTHGMLHLFGFDHENEFEKAVMFDLQDTILNKIKITRE